MMQGRFVEVLSILWSVLETIHDDFDAKEEGLWFTTLEVVKCISFTFCKLERDDPFLNEGTIEKSLELILATDQFHLLDGCPTIGDEELRHYMDSMFNLIVKLAGSHHLMNENAMASLTKLVQNNQRIPYSERLHLVNYAMVSLTTLFEENLRNPYVYSEGKSLLHMACENHLNIQHLAIPTIRLFPRAVAEPNAGYKKCK